jgi:beta-lactamase regulating signal transducer with metallopeptidase domain
MIAILADAVAKVTVLLVVALVATLCLRRASAALRHLIWALACGGVLAVPLVAALLPSWHVSPWPRPAAQMPSSVTALSASNVLANPAISRATPRPTDTPRHPDIADESVGVTSGTAVAHVPAASRPISWLFPVWVGGVALWLSLLGIGVARLLWLDRVSQPLDDREWQALLASLIRKLRIDRPVRLLQASGPAMPMTWGIRRPAILLPADARTWPLARRRDVLLHELAHVERGDFLTQLIARIACATYWFHPLVWLAATRLREERERACDDHVLRAGTVPSAYATHLLEIARGLRAARGTALASVAMARPAQLATRLIDVLDPGRRRDVLSRRAAVPAWIAAIAIVVPLAAIAPRVAQPAVPAASLDTIPRVPSPEPAARPSPALVHHGRSLVAVPAGAVAMSRVAGDTLTGCGTDGTRTSMHDNEGSDVMTINASIGHCIVTMDANGKFSFTDDFTDIASVTSGGRVMIEVDYGAHDRRITFTRGATGGGVDRVYKVDGDVQPFDAQARAWLAETLTALLRRSGYMGEERSRWILQTRGVQGLLDEIAQLSSDYARRIYYGTALASGKLDVAAYEKIIDDASRTIGSDYELSELLIAIANAQPLTAQMQAGFVRAAKKIGSDYEKHRVLKAALTRPGLTEPVEAAMLDAAATIGSDYELAELLIELNNARPIDEAVRPAYFTAADKIHSDYERRRVLAAVVTKAGTSDAMLADVLQSAKSISSDYELAELLTQVSNAYALDDALRAPYFAAAASIGSDFEHARVLTSVVERGKTSQPVVLAVLESAKGIGSDHELAELLLDVIRKVPMDDTIRSAVRADAEKIGSDYDRARVFETLR